MATFLFRPLTIILMFISPLAFSDNVGVDKKSHEVLIAGQEIIVIGCMGKLGIETNPSGQYEASTMAKVQSCADQASLDLSDQAQKALSQGMILKSQIPAFFVNDAVTFAQKHSALARSMSKEDLFLEALALGREHYPYKAE